MQGAHPTAPAPHGAGANAPAAPQCLHADDHLLVLLKPAGLLCVPGRGPDKQDCLSARAQAAWPGALVVHRLDQATSGIVLMARSLPMQRALSHAFAQRCVHKRYEAVAHGCIAPQPGWQDIALPLITDWPRRPRQMVDWTHGKPSLTRWRALGPGPLPGTSRVELEPITGRTHQLRVHMAAMGHALLGDALYASTAVQQQAARLLLHATQIAFTHPATGQRMVFDSAAPF